jgi:hypothetical protein
MEFVRISRRRTNGLNFVALGALKQEGDITKSNDTALVYSFNGAAFAPFAVEDATACDAGGAKVRELP